MRNREIALYLLVSVLISAAVAVPGFVLGGLCAGLLCLLLAALLIGWGLGFTLWRYRKIKTLSAALAASAAGGTVLTLTDPARTHPAVGITGDAHPTIRQLPDRPAEAVLHSGGRSLPLRLIGAPAEDALVIADTETPSR